MNNIKLLWIGDSPAVTTGFGRVAQSILERLAKTNKYSISVLGVNHPLGDPHRYEGIFKIYPARLQGNAFGFNRVEEVVNKENPDIIIINNDLWIAQEYVKYIPAGNKIIVYSPVDALPVSRKWVESINKVGAKIVTYTQFAKNGIQDAMNVPVEIIGHGVDTDHFYPIVDARSFIQNLSPDGFVIQNVNRNQPRKRLDLFFLAAKRWLNTKNKEERDNIFIYYHGAINDLGWNIPELASRWKIDDRIVITEQTNFTPASGVEIEYLSRIYASADLHVVTSMGEGFGLSPMESAACGVAQIVPEHSACKEIWKGTGSLIHVERSEVLSGGINTEGGVISVDHLVELFEHYYTHRDELKTMAKRCYELSQSKQYSWEYITEKFNSLIEYTLGSPEVSRGFE